MRRRDVLAAAAAAPLALAAAPGAARGQGQAEAILFSKALGLAQTTAVAYRQAAASGRLGPGLSATVRRFAEQKEDHVAALRTAVEGLGAGQPRPPAAVPGLEAAQAEGRQALVAFLAGLEEVALERYGAAVRQLGHPGLLGTVAQVMVCDAQQLAVLRAAAGEEPVTRAFETGRR